MIDLSFANASDSLIGSSIDSDLCNRMEAGTAESIRSSRDEKPTLSNITCLSAPVDYSDENDDDDGCGDDDNSEGEVMVIMMMMVMMMMSRMIVSHLVIPYDEP
jgi:hypothetical protein